MMNDVEKKESVRFVSKNEIVYAIDVLSKFTKAVNTSLSDGEYSFAEEKIKELVKLL